MGLSRKPFGKKFFQREASHLFALKQTTCWVVIACLATSGYAAQLQLAWDPPINANNAPSTTLAGYKLHYGLDSRTYSTTINVGNRTTFTLDGLEAGKTYYFTVTAYDKAGVESTYSEEVEATTAAKTRLHPSQPTSPALHSLVPAAKPDPTLASEPAPEPSRTLTTPSEPSSSIAVWLEAEEGKLQPDMEVVDDHTASSAAYVWTSSSLEDV
jgi:hypothetical protein